MCWPAFSARQDLKRAEGHALRLVLVVNAATPADRRYPAAVSRRTPVSFSRRRQVQPNWPNAVTCFCFSSLKTLLTLTEPIAPSEPIS